MIYLASPYSSPDPLIMKTRFLIAEQVTAGMLANNMWVYSPIVHCHELATKFKLPTDFGFWQRYNREMLRHAETMAVLQIPGWKESKGVQAEIEFARLAGIELTGVDDKGVFGWQE